MRPKAIRLAIKSTWLLVLPVLPNGLLGQAEVTIGWEDLIRQAETRPGFTGEVALAIDQNFGIQVFFEQSQPDAAIVGAATNLLEERDAIFVEVLQARALISLDSLSNNNGDLNVELQDLHFTIDPTVDFGIFSPFPSDALYSGMVILDTGNVNIITSPAGTGILSIAPGVNFELTSEGSPTVFSTEAEADRIVDYEPLLNCVVGKLLEKASFPGWMGNVGEPFPSASGPQYPVVLPSETYTNETRSWHLLYVTFNKSIRFETTAAGVIGLDLAQVIVQGPGRRGRGSASVSNEPPGVEMFEGLSVPDGTDQAFADKIEQHYRESCKSSLTAAQ